LELKLSFSDEIPDRYTQYGRNLSPEVVFRDVPEDAETLVFMIENINAPESLRVHWIIWNIPAETEALPEGLETAENPGEIEAVVQGNNDFDVRGYQGPRMFPGEEKYLFTAYALDTYLNLEPGNHREQVIFAMRGHVLDKAQERRGYTS